MCTVKQEGVAWWYSVDRGLELSFSFASSFTSKPVLLVKFNSGFTSKVTRSPPSGVFFLLVKCEALSY